MKLKKHLLITAVSILTAFSPTAKATLIAYEGFNYPAGGGAINDLNGGSGWITAWDSGNWRTPNTGWGENQTTLTFSNLSTMGTSARRNQDYNQSYRQFGPQTAAGTYWVSFLMNVDSADAGNSASLGVSLFDGGAEQNFMGKPSSGNWGVAGAGASSSGVAIVGGTTVWIVARYNMDTGIAHFWLNPSPGNTPSDASAWNGPGGTSFSAFSFDRIRLGSFGANGYIDEFSLGTTFADIAPANGVLIAYEGFNYPASYTWLDNLTGGSGWGTNGWVNSGWRTPNNGWGENVSTLTYSPLSTMGTSARPNNGGATSFRQFGPQTAAGTYWVSFIMNVDSADAGNSAALGVSLFNGGSEQCFMGKASSANWSVGGAGASASSVAIAGGSNTWIVARYDMDTGLAHFWVDPSLNTIPSDASAWNVPGGTSFTPFSFDRIRLGSFGANGYIDEFSFGTTFAKVAAHANVSASVKAAITVPSLGLAHLSFSNAMPHFSYVVQASTNLSGPWSNLSTNDSDASGSWLFNDSNATGSAKFYRAEQQ